MVRTKNDFAPTAPMGWNSYDYFNTAVNEQEVREEAEYMAAHLRQHGYQYVCIDIEWYSNDAGTQEQFQYIPFGDDEMDEYSRFIPSPNRFPSSAGGKGLGPLADYIHGLGLKLGIHIMRGIPRKAAEQHCKVLGTDLTADKIADPASICGWNPDMYGVRNTPAGQAYYDSIIALYAEWGIDFIKCDDICDSWTYRETNHNAFTGWYETRMLHKAIMKSGRPIVLSLSPGPAQLPRAWEYADNANMWRITDDFWDDWELLKPMFWRCETWLDHVKPGCYPDCDMLPVGTIGKNFPDRLEHETHFTRDEQKTMMTLWTMFGAPLIIGADLRQMDDWTLRLLTNDRLLALLDGHHTGTQVERDDDHAVWKNTDTRDGSLTVAFFNTGEADKDYAVDLPELLALEPGAFTLTELWDCGDLSTENGKLTISVPKHGVRVFAVKRAE